VQPDLLVQQALREQQQQPVLQVQLVKQVRRVLLEQLEVQVQHQL
jgi:hypothetical protein